jgi:hypothetical protein
MTTSAEMAAPLWDCRVSGADLSGYVVYAGDGPVGEVIVAHIEVGRSYLVVQGGTWIDGRMLMLPAGLVESIDIHATALLMGCSRAEIASAPPFEGDRYQDGAYRAELGAHYERLVSRPASPAAAGSAGAPWMV